MSDTPQVLLAHHLKALKLPTFLREYDRQALQCAAEGVDYARYLLRLAEHDADLLLGRELAPRRSADIPDELLGAVRLPSIPVSHHRSPQGQR